MLFRRLAERPPQGEDVNAEIALLDNAVGPHLFNQLIFAEHTPALFDQSQQQIERHEPANRAVESGVLSLLPARLNAGLYSEGRLKVLSGSLKSSCFFLLRL